MSKGASDRPKKGMPGILGKTNLGRRLACLALLARLQALLARQALVACLALLARLQACLLSLLSLT